VIRGVRGPTQSSHLSLLLLLGMLVVMIPRHSILHVLRIVIADISFVSGQQFGLHRLLPLVFQHILLEEHLATQVGYLRTHGLAGQRWTGDWLGHRVGENAVDGQCDGAVPAAQHQTVGDDLLLRAIQVNAVVLVVPEQAEVLECRRSRHSQVIDEELQVELGGVGGAQANAAGKVCLDSGAERNDPHLCDEDRLGKLHQIQIDVL